MAEQETARELTPERLMQYEGPPLGRHLRREMKEQVALLYEKLMILRLVDPDFERELEQLGALEFLDRYTEHLAEEQERMRGETDQSLERLRKARRANEEAPTK
jgi:hypothetical protein